MNLIKKVLINIFKFESIHVLLFLHNQLFVIFININPSIF